MREFMQVGVELLGAPAPDGTAEVVEVLCAALDAAGLSRAVIGLGDADLYGQLLLELGIDGDAAERILDRLAIHDLVGLEAEIEAAGVDQRGRETLLALPNLRGGREILERAHELGGEAVERATSRLQATYEALEAKGMANRVRLDLGLLRDLGYYTGAILEVYDPALGHILGGGGRYDDLLGRFGWDLPAVGFALFLERLHVAQAEEERIAGRTADDAAHRRQAHRRAPIGGLKLAVPKGALWEETVEVLDRIGIDTGELRSESRSLAYEAEA